MRVCGMEANQVAARSSSLAERITLHWLPFPRAETPFCSLPFADRSAQEMESAWLRISRRERCRDLVELLSRDPAVTLWVVTAAYCRDQREVTDLADAARWLEENTFRGFSWHTADETCVDRSARAALGRLTAAGVVVGQWAEQAAAAKPHVCPRQARLLGLLHNADRWPRITADGNVQLQGQHSDMPPWLAEQLDAVRHMRSPVGCCVGRAAEAVGKCLGAPRPAWDDAVADSDLWGDYLRATARWSTVDTAVRQRLPMLIARLAAMDNASDAFQQAVEQEKLHAMKELAYGASHEINNPLANISVRAQTLLKDESDPERRRKLAAINSQAFRAHEMIADLMLFARPPKIEVTRIRLAQVLERVRQELHPRAAGQQTALRLAAVDARLAVMADEVQLAVVVRALCENALESLGHGGHVVLSATSGQSGGSGRCVRIDVTDDGPGIAPEIRARIFDPFFSGREAGRGLGFGLSKCWRIITQHGGRLDVESASGRGTTLRVTLPVNEKATLSTGHAEMLLDT